MIYYVVSHGATRFLQRCLDTYMPSVAERLTVLNFYRLPLQRSLMPGTYIFAQIEILSPSMARALGRLHDSMIDRSGFRVVNDPHGSLRRYELLTTLHHEGLNTFRVYPLDEHPEPEKYPLFLRGENDHSGGLTRLLETPDEFRKAAKIFGARRNRPEKDIAIEFCDTADSQGVYRKYAAFIFGDRIVPRHLFFSKDWMLKHPGKVISPEEIEEEKRFVDENPHEEQLRKIFDMAQIQYGRIDYAVLDGKVQTWEINTHPQLMGPHDYTYHPARSYVQDRYKEGAIESFTALDDTEGGKPFSMSMAERYRLCLTVLFSKVHGRFYVRERKALQRRLRSAGLYVHQKGT